MANVSSSNGLEKRPKLRFPGFDEPWKAIHLSDVGEASSGFGFPDAYQGEETSEIPFYKVSDMNLPKNTKIMQQSNNYVSQSTAKKLRVRPFSENAIVFAKVGAAISHERKRIALSPFLIDNNMMAFTPKQKEDLEFIYHLFQKIKLSKYSQVGALPSYNASDILDIRTFYPTSGNERKKIVTILNLVDNRIGKQSEIITNLKKYKRGLNHKLLSEIDEQYNRELGTVCSIVGGGTPDTLRPEYWEGNVEWFTPSEIGKSKYVLSSLRKISQVGLSNSSAKSLPSGTVLLTTRATLGEMSIARSECSTNQGFQSLVSDSKRVLPEYLYYLQILIKPWCEKYASGNTFREISKASLSKCVVPVPCLNSQKRIVCILSRIDELIETHERVEDSLTQIKEGLLQQLFI